MTKRMSVAIISCFLAFVLGGFTHWLMEKNDMPHVHRLEAPLLLVGGDANAGAPSMLPRGATLYYDQAFPEGFVRYLVYVNVEGVNLETHESDEQFPIKPLTAFPIDKDQLQMMLRDYPLTKDDLAAVLNSSALSKDEIRELLTEYSN